MLTLQLIGHLGQDAEIKTIGTNKYISFSVAHTEKFTDSKGVKTERTQWVSCLKYGESQVIGYLKKGTQVYVTGKMTINVVESKAYVNLNVSDLVLLGSKEDKPKTDSNEPVKPSGDPFGAPMAMPKDELPW